MCVTVAEWATTYIPAREKNWMAKVISTLFISADGVAEVDPAWHFPYFDENMGRAVGEDYATADVLLLGRVTYDSFAGAWPERENAGGEDASFAVQLGDTRKIVVSRQPLEFTWRESELVQGDLAEAVAARLSITPEEASGLRRRVTQDCAGGEGTDEACDPAIRCRGCPKPMPGCSRLSPSCGNSKRSSSPSSWPIGRRPRCRRKFAAARLASSLRSA